MTKQDALQLLKNAPRSTTIKSKVNPIFSQSEAVKIVTDGIIDGPNGELHSIMEKRVWQVVKHQRRPRY